MWISLILIVKSLIFIFKKTYFFRLHGDLCLLFFILFLSVRYQVMNLFLFLFYYFSLILDFFFLIPDIVLKRLNLFLKIRDLIWYGRELFFMFLL
jgi:hypothetical protein